jgi:MFS family permease
MTFPSGLRALDHRDYRIFFAGQAVALVGAWMQQIAQAWLVLSLTNSPLRLGLVGSLNFTPVLLFAIVGGAVADRLPKRRLLVITQSVLACQTLILATLIWTGHVRYWHICVLAVVWGIANTIDLPTRQSFVVELVGRADVTNAVALNSAAFNAARIVGPAIGGLLIAHAGVAPAYFINGFAFLVVIATLLIVRARGAPLSRGATTIGQEIGEGVRYALRTPRITLTLAMVLAVSVFLFNYNVTVPLLARDVLHQGARGFGLLMTTLGVGAVGGAVTLAIWSRGRPPVAALAAPALVQAVATAMLATASTVPAAAALLLTMGFCGILFMAGSNSTLQLTVPDELRGRVMSLHTLMFAGVTPFGSLLVGSLAEAFGIRTSLVVSSGCGVVAVLALLVWWNGRDRGPSMTIPRRMEGPA